ncbi:MAG: sigma-70 family RNA polymerase sigma factor [Sarcina sp.]
MGDNIKTLIEKAKNQDEDAKNIIIEKYKPLINKAAFSYYIRGYEIEDLVQMGILWLLMAIEKYNINLKSDFSSYAMRTIHNNMKALIRKKAKENYEKSLQEEFSVGKTIEDILIDNFDLVSDLEERYFLELLVNKLKTLEKKDMEFILEAYANKTGNLSKIAKERELSYAAVRRKRDKIVKNLKKAMEAN